MGFVENTLKFRCIVVKDPKRDTLMQKLEETATHLNDNARDYYCFIFFIMGHGTQVCNVTINRYIMKNI